MCLLCFPFFLLCLCHYFVSISFLICFCFGFGCVSVSELNRKRQIGPKVNNKMWMVCWMKRLEELHIQQEFGLCSLANKRNGNKKTIIVGKSLSCRVLLQQLRTACHGQWTYANGRLSGKDSKVFCFYVFISGEKKTVKTKMVGVPNKSSNQIGQKTKRSKNPVITGRAQRHDLQF